MASQAFLSAEAAATSSVTVAGNPGSSSSPSSSSSHTPFNIRTTTNNTPRVPRQSGRLSSSLDQWCSSPASHRLALAHPTASPASKGSFFASSPLGHDFRGRKSTRHVSKLHSGRQKFHNVKHSPHAEHLLHEIINVQFPALLPPLLHAWSHKLVASEDYAYLVRELGNVGEGEKALAVFEWAVTRDMLRSEWCKLLSITISALGRLGKVNLAQEIFDKALAAGFGRNVYAYSALVSAYGRNGRCREALDLFELMKKAGCKPNLITYNTVIDACGKGGVDLSKATEIFEEMQRERVEPDRITFNSLIAVCSRGNLWEEAQRLFEMMQQRGINQDIFTYNTLVDAVCKAGEMDRAASIVSSMQKKSLQPNVVTYSTLIDGYGKAGRFSEALSVYNEMKYACIEPDRVSYNTLLYIYAKLGKFEEAHFICKQMEMAGCKKDAVTYNALLDAYGKQGRYREASYLFEKMKAEGVAPTLLTYSTLVDAFCKGGLYQEAMETFWEFKAAGLKPDVVLYSSVIDAFCKSGLVSQASNLLEEMMKEGIQPNVITYNSIIDAYSRLGQVDTSGKISDTGKIHVGPVPPDFQEKLLSPASQTVGLCEKLRFTCLEDSKVPVISSSQHALSLKGPPRDILVKVFREMRKLGVKPNVVTFSAILHACSRCSSFLEATMLLEELRGFDSRVYGVAYGLLMGSSRQVWGDAEALFDQVSRMDHSTAAAFYNALADVLWHFGQRNGAQKVVLEAKRRHVWKHSWQHSDQQFCLDLHLMSVGAAQAMLHIWLLDIRSIVREGYELPKLLSILTGWGKHSKIAGESIVKRALESHLSEIGAPFRVARYNEGRFVSTGSTVVEWLQEPTTLRLLVLHDMRIGPLERTYYGSLLTVLSS